MAMPECDGPRLGRARFVARAGSLMRRKSPVCWNWAIGMYTFIWLIHSPAKPAGQILEAGVVVKRTEQTAAQQLLTVLIYNACSLNIKVFSRTFDRDT